MSAKDRIILGIDPGTTIMGFGVIEINRKKAKYIAMDAIRLSSLSDPYLKLRKIFFATIELIDMYNPDELAIEAPFFGKNVQSMLKLGRAQGVAIAAAVSRDIPIFEYAPRKIKMAITGQGAASKEQVAYILSKTLSFDDIPKDLDATDGLAVALCHFYQDKAIPVSNGAKGWSDFIKKNPDRVK
ncbi:MAG: crossover junction endodeoxyribonuclease RuvC [Bacteroidales bacterium]|nr:crossover junction endodeoxyribonuclease RuvC [Bacteroidales bacterium]MCF8390895.1 crossover junction endodeoxyribonuclease RuvC [Bacteroidales bacterium]